jgi:hypothetical protein
MTSTLHAARVRMVSLSGDSVKKPDVRINAYAKQ